MQILIRVYLPHIKSAVIPKHSPDLDVNSLKLKLKVCSLSSYLLFNFSSYILWQTVTTGITFLMSNIYGPVCVSVCLICVYVCVFVTACM